MGRKHKDRAERAQLRRRNEVHSAFRTAIERRDLDEVRALLDRGAPVNTSFCGSIEGRHPWVIDADYSPLLLAVVLEDCEMVKLLLERGADPSIQATTEAWVPYSDDSNVTEGQDTAIEYAIRQGAMEMVDVLVEHQPRDHLDGLLVCAVEATQFEIAKLLINRGAGLEGVSKYSVPPLAVAARKNDVAMAEWLLDIGADINACHERGNTALNVAVEYGSSEVFDLLLERGATVGTWELQTAAQHGRHELARRLLQLGADPNGYGRLQQPPLMCAAFRNDIEMLEILLDAGASIHETSSQGQTALGWAMSFNKIHAIQLLRSRGAKR